MTKALAPLLDANTVALDLRYVSWRKTTGKNHAYGTWLLSGDAPEPCMVLLRGDVRPDSGKAVPCVIRLSDAWRWTDEVGDHVRCAIQVIDWLACGFLVGNPHDNNDIYAVITLVQSRLNDLLTMPPLPPVLRDAQRGNVIAEVSLKDSSTGRTVEKEIRDVH